MWRSKYNLPLFFILLLSGTYGCKDDGGKIVHSGELKLLSYNVAGLPELLSSSSPETYTSSISPLLNEFDIVHVQEDFCYHDLLIESNTHSFASAPMPCVPEGDGLNTFSDFPIRNFDRQAWRDCNGFDCLTPKGFSYSQIEIESGYTIDFYNIHCNAGSENADFEARRKNLAQVIDYMEMHSTGQSIVIMGDFNCRYTREEDDIRRFTDMGFSDLWIDLIRDGKIPAISDDKLNECDVMTTHQNCEGVDKILYRSNDNISLTANLFQYGDDSRYYYQGDLTQPLSDHEPLFARISYEIQE